MDNNEHSYVVCQVCGGKGGWKVDRKDRFDNNWHDCLFCNGYGFLTDQEKDDKSQSFLLDYALYKKILIELLVDSVGNVESYTTEDMGKTIEIKIVPYHKGIFTEFTKVALKYSHFSNALKINIIQDYYYKPEGSKFLFGWKIILKTTSISDLDGFIDIVKIFEREKNAT